MLTEIIQLIRKEFFLELKRPERLASVGLYLLAVIFVTYLLFREISPQLWNLLYWLLILFAAIQLGGRIFEEEMERRRYYYMQMAGAESFFIAKVLYLSVLIFLLEIVCTAGLCLVTDYVPPRLGVFLMGNILSAIGIAGILTFTSGTAGGIRKQSTLISVLSFPLLIPVLLQGVGVNLYASGTLREGSLEMDLLLFSGINLLIFSLGLALFTYLWKE